MVCSRRIIMPEPLKTNDIKIFSGMVEILIASILEEEDYGFSQEIDQTRYEEIATAMNEHGFSNRYGNPLNQNALKQVVYRVRRNEKYKDIWENLRPEWDKFRDTDYGSIIKSKETKTDCLVCGVSFTKTAHRKRAICSYDCVKEYQKHKDVPHNPLFHTVYHQIKYENDITARE